MLWAAAVISRISRRDFLRLAGLASAATLLPACGSDGSQVAADEVLVIGAGFSGLTVANALTAAGRSVQVIEARSRLGGRTWTAPVGDINVDLGGAWIHGPNGNPVACLARQNGIGWTSAEVVGPGISVFDTGNGFLPNQVLGTFLVAMSGFEEQIADLRAALGPSASLTAGVQLYLDRAGLTGDARRYADFSIRQGIGELFYGGPADETSLEQLLQDEEFLGGNHFPEGGYRRLVELLADGVGVDLSREVRSISHGPRGVIVETSGGAYRGSHAVITIPLGVLKTGRIRFDPPLPEWKQGAIDRLAMANFEKVVLLFDRAFWADIEPGNIIYLSQTYGEYPAFFDLTPFVGRPALLCFYGGIFARGVDGRGDTDIVDRILAILGEMFGAQVMAPTAATVTRWREDPYALGSYSFVPIGATLEDMNMLAEPVAGRLLFAGEATVPAYYGTVHAAMLSGLREAKRLLEREDIDLLTGPAPDIGCS